MSGRLLEEQGQIVCHLVPIVGIDSHSPRDRAEFSFLIVGTLNGPPLTGQLVDALFIDTHDVAQDVINELSKRLLGGVRVELIRSIRDELAGHVGHGIRRIRLPFGTKALTIEKNIELRQ
jgi:hypothetical protein